MLRKLSLCVALLLLSACSWFRGAQEQPVSPPPPQPTVEEKKAPLPSEVGTVEEVTSFAVSDISVEARDGYNEVKIRDAESGFLDVEGYRFYRRVPNGEFVFVGAMDGFAVEDDEDRQYVSSHGAAFNDYQIESGQTYQYSVSRVSVSGKEGPQSHAVEVQSKRGENGEGENMTEEKSEEAPVQMEEKAPQSGVTRDQLFSSCVAEVETEKYCNCMADGLVASGDVSEATRSRLAAKFTTDINEATGGQEPSEMNEVGSVHISCLILMFGG